MKLRDELEIMDHTHPEGFYSLRLWVVGKPEGGTWGRVDWVISDSKGRAAHQVNLARFTWNGELDLPMRGIICAREMISQAYDKLDPI